MALTTQITLDKSFQFEAPQPSISRIPVELKKPQPGLQYARMMNYNQREEHVRLGVELLAKLAAQVES